MALGASVWLPRPGLSQPAADPSAIQRFDKAVLQSKAGTREVDLPHVLEPGDFVPEGSLVRYRLTWDLPEAPTSPQAVFISKLSLSGRLWVNGELIGHCGDGPLEELRCLHQPQLFRFPAGTLTSGSNILELEILATSRQMNGLSPVQAGDADALISAISDWNYFLRTDLALILIGLSLLLGLLSLTVGLILRSETVFLWFGLTSIIHALASLNGVIVHPPVDIDIYNWIVFWSRLVSVPLSFLTVLSIFGKDGRRITWLLVGYCLLSPVLIWLSGNSRTVTFALYVPLVFSCPYLLWCAIRWARQSRTPMHFIATLLMLILFLGGLADWLRLGGRSSFEGVYLSVYTYSGMLVTIGLLLLTRLAGALLESRKSGAMLERQIAERIAYEVTENIPVGTFTLTRPPKSARVSFSFASRRFLQITGLDEQELQRDVRKLFRVVHPDDLQRLLEVTRQAFRSSQSLSVRFRIGIGGQTRWINVESAPRDRADGSTVWEGVLIDETDQVLALQAADRDRAALQAHLVAQSRLDERESLLRDMHDGFGSQLASVRLMIERGLISPQELPAYLREVSADLHLVVDTLGQRDITLEEALYDMRYRLKRRFEGTDLQFDWDLALDGLPAQSAREILQILRIAQEAIHNAIRHAEPRRITVSVRYDSESQQLDMSISDDGIGLPETPTGGRGLDNMRTRAREVGGSLTIQRAERGTRVQLLMQQAQIRS